MLGWAWKNVLQAVTVSNTVKACSTDFNVIKIFILAWKNVLQAVTVSNTVTACSTDFNVIKISQLFIES